MSDVTLEQVLEGADWDPPSEFVYPTPGQVWAMMLSMPVEERLRRLQGMIDAGYDRQQCIIKHGDHEQMVAGEMMRVNALDEVNRKLVSIAQLQPPPKGTIQSIVQDAVTELLTDLRKRLTGAAK